MNGQLLDAASSHHFLVATIPALAIPGFWHAGGDMLDQKA
jgi:hypothetical protein